MPTTDRHQDRWIVRASLAGLVVVLCFLVGFSVVTRHSVAVKSASADRATRLRSSASTGSRAATPSSSPTVRPSGG